MKVYISKINEGCVCEIFVNNDYIYLNEEQTLELIKKMNEFEVKKVGELLEKAIEVLGVNDEITIAISQRLDEEIVKQQKKLNELEEYKKLMVEEFENPSEYQKVFEDAFNKSQSAIKGENYFE